MTTLKSRAAELLAIRALATPGPWCWENCGEKCDALVVGVAFCADDMNCEHQLSGMLDPSIDYTREGIALEIQPADGYSATHNAAFIASAHRLADCLAEAMAEVGRLEVDAARYRKLRASMDSVSFVSEISFVPAYGTNPIFVRSVGPNELNLALDAPTAAKKEGGKP